jgi:hypothetical protein
LFTRFKKTQFRRSQGGLLPALFGPQSSTIEDARAIAPRWEDVENSVAQFLGRRLAYTYEIVEFIPGERLVMRSADGPFPMETTYAWQPLGTDRTRMTLRNRGTPTGFSAWAAPFMAYVMRRANRKDLALLKGLLESAGAAGA